MNDLPLLQLVWVVLIFIWSGFVRSGLGFGGAALALPLLLLVIDAPLLWLPIVANHLLFFSALTVYNRLHYVDWPYLRKALLILLIPKLLGVFGLINLPGWLLVNIIYGITLLYALTYVFNYTLQSGYRLLNTLLLCLGGYASGVSLIGAPLISAVFAQHVPMTRLRDTLFVLWMILVSIKVSTLIAFDVDMRLAYSLYLLPAVAIGHLLGLRVYRYLSYADGGRYKLVLGLIMLVICGYGLVRNNVG